MQVSMYKKHVSEPWFSLIKNGTKTVEGRLNKGEFSKMKKGDIITWFNDKKTPFRTKILSIKKYKSFEDYLRKERLKNTLPGITRINKGVAIYYKFFTKEMEKTFGVLAIRLKVMK